MGRARKGDTAAEPLAEAAIEAMAVEVRREGAVPLARLGAPKARLAEAKKALAARGLEVTAKVARVPVADQLAARLREIEVVPFRGVADAVAGASKKEALAAADALVAGGHAARVVRSKELLLVAKEGAVLDDGSLAALERSVAALAAALKLARAKKATLLHADVRNELGAFAPAPAPAPRRGPTEADVAALVARHRESSGLTFVPKIVRALGGPAVRDAVHAALIQGAKSGRYELRPESGMGRLSDDDLGLCVPGPQGSHLSWVRRIEEGA
jgi:hypothetical protein